jgi:glucokinase
MGTRSLLLAGDVGGTKTKLALYERAGQSLRCVCAETYTSADYPAFSQVVADFLADTACGIGSACFGVAGPVRDGRCQTTNLPWLLDERELASCTGIEKIKLLNDLQAMALGLLRVPADELVELNPQARPAAGNKAIVAAGTGFGEALLYWDGETYHAIATEGGHADFAPNNPLEDGLLTYLRPKFGGHVSYERILSGPGLFNIYQYLRDRGDVQEFPLLVERLRAGGDPGRLIAQAGLEENDPLCRESLRLFASVYGAETGNWALKTLALGGVLVGGGIAPKILPALRDGAFLEGFSNKGRFAELLRPLSVKVSLNEDAGLLGAAHRAAELGSH